MSTLQRFLFIVNWQHSLYGHSSVHVGVCFRKRAEELEKAWWSEQGELSSGPAAAGKNAVPEDEAASTKWQVLQLHCCCCAADFHKPTNRL